MCCPIHNPAVFNLENQEMCYPVDFFHSFGLIYEVLEQIQLAAHMATLGNFRSLQKSKMNADCHLDNFSFEPLVLECSAIPLFGRKI